MSINIDPQYEAKKYEDKIYKKWETSGAFSPKKDPKKKPFVISMPPPNATGELHLGHAFMLAIEDLMIRHNRMKGTPTLWLPGTDHASIATQTKVEKLLMEKGISKEDLGRTKFIKEVRDYVEKSRHKIRNQIRKMGASCDWTRERYTLDKGLTNAVQEVFLRMYKDGLIYRGDRIVNWSPGAGSTLADDEVEYKEVTEKLYWIKYGPFTVATTRPETMLGDTAVAVHPKDKRYKSLVGKTVKIPYPLGTFTVKVVADNEVDMNFGSGAVKVTPAHSFTDFEIAKRHSLPVKMVIDEKGKMMKNCGKYAGMTSKECRKKYVEDLEKIELIEKIEPYTHNLSICYRSGQPIEPLISKQWFIDVNKPVIKDGNKKISLKEKALEVVKDGDIKIIPNRFYKIYFDWLENLHDWCISRQIWFGHRIPIFYCQNCEHIVAAKEKPEKCEKCASKKLKQDADTLDTWFSSGLWTFSTLGWPEKTEDFKYFHPTSVMETGYDIIFFWVARMIIMTTYTLNEIPFETVYLHGMIRDRQGRKMSKSLANGIDPLDMINKYGADAVRLSLLIGTTAGNDLKIYEEKIAGFRNFVNKIWNASRFALMNIKEEEIQSEFEVGMIKTSADKWILTRLQKLIKETNNDIENFKFSEAGIKIYDFIWSLFCDWYLEMSKGTNKNPAVLVYVLKEVLKLLHPFTPFVSEKIWEIAGEKELLISAKRPQFNQKLVFEKDSKEIEIVSEIITKIRSKRSELQVEPAKMIDATIYAGKMTEALERNKEILMRLSRLKSLEIKEKGAKIPKSATAVVKSIEIYLPLKEMIDMGKELEKIEKQIKEKRDFIDKLRKKLENKGFSEKAPKEVVQKEKDKLKIEIENLEKLKKQKNQTE